MKKYVYSPCGKKSVLKISLGMLTFLGALLISNIAISQTITTFAGTTNVAGNTGNGGPATAATLSSPWGIVIDAAGNKYISAAGIIRKINTSGAISIFAGSGTPDLYSGEGGQATAATLAPSGLALDATGNMYVADVPNNRVYKINTAGVITTFAGTGTANPFNGDSGPATAANVASPIDVAVDAAGNVYIADQSHHRVRMVNTLGVISTVAGNGGSGNDGDGGQATAAMINFPTVVEVDNAGNLYIVGNGNQVRKVTPAGIISTVAGTIAGGFGGDGGPATAAAFAGIGGVTFDALGNMYLSDANNHRIRKVNATGIINTIAGTGAASSTGDGGPATAATLNIPLHLVMDNSGNLNFVDNAAHVGRLFLANSAPSFVGGSTQGLVVCQNSGATSVNSLLAVTDADAGQTETWSVISPATNGTVVATYSVTSTGGTLTPTGLTYTPTTGYSGTDAFTVQVNDGSGGIATTTINVTVNATPAAITGTTAVCENSTTTLATTTAGGTWSSSNTTIATIGTDGVVTGMNDGTATISYTLPAMCYSTATVTVNALPATITGIATVCENSATTLANADAGGTWASSNTTIAVIDAGGVVTGIDDGTAIITYTLPTTCYTTASITVNVAPAAITGITTVCENSTTTLANTDAGGTWSSSNTSLATVGTDGVVTGINDGVSTITYTLSATCYITAKVTVNPTPEPLTGTMTVCENSTTILVDGAGGGTWSSSNTSVATVDMFGMVTGVNDGTATITYAFAPTGCFVTATVTVNASPAAITGTTTVCENSTTMLANTDAGGTWSSSATSIATVDAAGMVTGISGGIAMITYAFSTGCHTTATVTVNLLPGAISGTGQVCVGGNTTLMNADAGGTWSSSDNAIATIGSATGVVSGVAVGNATITYTLATSCMRTLPVTVNALPNVYNVTGGGIYCIGGPGVHIGLDNSQAGYTYDLYRGITLVTSQVGSGAAVDFGSITTGGPYSVTATSPASCVSNMSGSVTVTPTPPVMPMVSVSSVSGDTICSGTSVTFTATPVNGGPTPGYAWTVNGSPVGSTSSTFTYLPVNGDVVSATLTSSETCVFPATVSSSMTMVVFANETPSVTIAVGPNDTLCQGATATFSVGVTAFTGTAPVYTWYRNGVSTGITGTTYTYVPVNGNIITARLNSSYRCPTTNNVASNGILMHIDSTYIPVATFNVYPNVNIKAGTTVTITATVTDAGPAPTYQWVKNGTVVAGATSATYISSTFVNNDSISCIVFGTGGCSYYTFNAVKMRVSTGLVPEALGRADIKLVPNPNTGDFAVRGILLTTDDREVSFEVANMLGQVVYSNTVITHGGNLDERVQVSNTLANGMYMLQVRAGTESKMFRFVVQH